MNSLDIIIFGVATIFLAMRLWSILGQRDEDEQNRPPPQNPFSQQPPQDDENVMILPARKSQASPMGADITIHGYAAASLAGGLDQMRCLDASFDEKTFLQGAKMAFEAIVSAFSAGDLSPVQRLLSPDVYESFSLAIEARKMAGHKLETKIVKIKEAEVEAARVEGSVAFLTIRIISVQINVVRDVQNEILSGNESLPEEIQDIWLFARDTRASDPNWQLIETRN